MKTVRMVDISESELQAIAKAAAQAAAREAVKRVLEVRQAGEWAKWYQEQLRKREEWEKAHGKAVAEHLKITK